MKRLMMTVAALCVAGVASAITAGWTTVCDVSSVASNKTWRWESNQAKNGITYNGNADFAVRVTFTDVTVKSAQNDWGGLLGVASSDDIYSFQNHQKHLWVTEKSDVKQNFFTWEGEKDFSVTLAYDDTAHTLSFYLDDERIHMLSNVDVGAWVTFGVGSDGRDTRSLDRIFSGGSYKVEFTDDLGLVPEPTALALLALGVAGVALRRRVA